MKGSMSFWLCLNLAPSAFRTSYKPQATRNCIYEWLAGWLRDENPSKWAYFTAFPMRNDSRQSTPTTRFYSHADGFRNILKGFLQQLILSSLYGRMCEVLYFPIKDDESDLVILAGPKLYSPMSKTFSDSRSRSGQ